MTDLVVRSVGRRRAALALSGLALLVMTAPRAEENTVAVGGRSRRRLRRRARRVRIS